MRKWQSLSGSSMQLPLSPALLVGRYGIFNRSDETLIPQSVSIPPLLMG